jgi:DNA-binding Lrp family transcriptional regulator
MKPETDAQDRRLLDLLQAEFPLDPEPFARLGEKAGESAAAVIERIQRLKRDHVIRQISAIFDTRALGYRSSLVAMKVPPARADQAAQIINSHPGVSHNYKRNHEFNLWFTVAVAPNSRLGLKATVEKLHELARADSTRLLPTLRLYKIGIKLDMTGEQDVAAASDEATYSDLTRPKTMELSPRQIAAIRELQKDVALVERPFDAAAARVGLTVDQLLEEGRAFRQRGQMRRFAAVLHHRHAGYVANAMGVWKVPDGNPDAIGQVMASFNAVSHCYRRPTYPDWPYSIFTMIHGRSVEDCERVLSAISEKTGITEYRALYSTREYKKTRVQYFTPDSEEWEEQVMAGAAVNGSR